MTKVKKVSGKCTDYDYTPHHKNYDITTKIKMPKERIRELIRMELRKLEDEHRRRISMITDDYLKRLIEFSHNKSKKEPELKKGKAIKR